MRYFVILTAVILCGCSEGTSYDDWSDGIREEDKNGRLTM